MYVTKVLGKKLVKPTSWHMWMEQNITTYELIQSGHNMKNG